jgi:hypothetical protein
MNNTLELFPIKDFIDPNHPVTDRNSRKSKSQNRESEMNQIARDLIAEWEQKGIDPNYVLLEMKLQEIKQVLMLCSTRQQEQFACRLTEWIFFNTEVTGM